MSNCELPLVNASEPEILSALQNSKTIAVVGLSNKPDRASHMVAEYLKQQGYKIIPVNPQLDSVLGEKSYPDLNSIPEQVDLVDIFRKPDVIPEIVNQAIEIGAKYIWMQSGIVNNQAAETARNAGLTVIMNRCIMVDHRNMA